MTISQSPTRLLVLSQIDLFPMLPTTVPLPVSAGRKVNRPFDANVPTIIFGGSCSRHYTQDGKTAYLNDESVEKINFIPLLV